MSVSSDSAEQIVRLSLEGMEVIARISGVAAKNVAVALYAVMQDKQKTKGKTRLNNMIRSEKELKIFSVKKDDLKTFCKQAKVYGIIYCALVNRKNRNIDDVVDIMVRAEDAPRINRIVERYNIITHDKASIQSSIEKEIEANRNKDLLDSVQDIGEQKKDINDAMIDDIFTKPIAKEENTNQNPNAAKTEKNPPSELFLESNSNSEGVSKSVKKESVRKKLEDIKAEQKIEAELKETQKSKSNVKIEQTNIQTQKPKATTKKERGK